MTEIENFRLFEERKFKQQLAYLKKEENQKQLKDLPLNELLVGVWIFVKVFEVKKSSKDEILLLVEDLTGTREVVYSKKDENDMPFIVTSYFNLKLEIKKDHYKDLYKVFIMEYKPVGYRNEIKIKGGDPVYGALISDVHIGSIFFMKNQFISFLKYLQNTPKVKYLFIAGDLVDGIGIYPEQEKNLYQKNAYLQYDEVKVLFDTYLTRRDIIVYFSPGNHDFLTLFEPQILSEAIKNRLPSNWIFLDNPEYITLEGKRILFYHGRSVDNLISSKTPFLSYDKMHKVYHYMFSQRNLSPTVKGSRLNFKKYTGMIDEIPDIFLSGHVHKWCSSLQNGVLFCNSGCWQFPTEYQKNLDIVPIRGESQFINLNNPNGPHYRIDFKQSEIFEKKFNVNATTVSYIESDEKE